MLPKADRAIRVSVASNTDMPKLTNLFQLYRYDISASRGESGQDVLPDGRYPDPHYLSSFWTDPRCLPFLVRVDDRLAGFVLVRSYSQLTDDPTVHDILDFFIMRKYRGQGVGTTVAIHIFDLFVGQWEVREYKSNHAAQTFWQGVIASYTNGQYTELTWDDERHRGIVQRFETTVRPSTTVYTHQHHPATMESAR